MFNKKLGIYAILTVIALTMSACGSNSKSSGSSPSASATAAPTVSASVSPSASPSSSASASPSASPSMTPAASASPAASPAGAAAPGGATTLTVSATNWKFDKTQFEAAADKEVTINFESKEGIHGFRIEGTNVNISGKGTAKVTLKPGEYTIRCSVMCGDGHSNMTAKLIVK